MKLHKEGFKIIPVAFLILAVLDVIIYFLLKEYFIFYPLDVRFDGLCWRLFVWQT